MGISNQTGLAVSIEGKSAKSLIVPGWTTKQLYTLVPNNLLPTEILSEIFKLAVLPSPCIRIASAERKLHPLVVIPSVCTIWRHLAISLGSLWSHVDVYMAGHRKDDRALISLDQMRLWLERAGGAPMNFHVCFDQLESGDPQLSDILGPHMSRAVSLTFSLARQVHTQDLLNIYGAHCPLGQLQVLSITRTAANNLSTLDWPTNRLQGLTVLELVDLGSSVCPSLDELVWLLSNSPALHTLRLDGTVSRGRHNDSSGPIILPNLKHVEIAPFDSSSRYYSIFKALVPGNLALHVRVQLARCQSMREEVSALAVFLKRSNTVYLSFMDQPGLSTLPECLEVLDSAPELQFLSFETLEHPRYDMPTAPSKIFEGTGLHARRNDLRILHLQHIDMNRSMRDRMEQFIETRQPEKIIIGPQVKGLNSFIIQPRQGTRVDLLRELVGLVARSRNVELPIGESLS
ncbi:hypothetical protein FRC12_010039 [Ceratobasidium sp. 428]|nr:hypothetical protein FRC12_010039 [Ceratobasidium sp. 428]